MEGFTHLIPNAAHEVIRQERRNLTLIRMTPDLIYDQLIGMGGCAEMMIFSYVGNPGVGSLPLRVRGFEPAVRRAAHLVHKSRRAKE